MIPLITINRRRLAGALVAASIMLPVQAQTIDSDQVFVADYGQQWAHGGSLFSVDPNDGSRTLISDFGNTAQGPQGGQLTGMALLDADTMLVLDNLGGPFGPAMMSVDLNTGQRSVISEFENWWDQGVSTFYVAGDIVVTDDGKGLVAAPFSGSDFRGALLSVDLSTGFRTAVTSFGNPAQGPVDRYPISVLQTMDGETLVLTTGFGSGGALYSVDMSNGQRTLISDFSNPAQGLLGSSPIDMVELPTGDIYVVDGNRIMRVLRTGNRQLISDLTSVLQGPLGATPAGLAVDGAGQLVVTETSTGLLLTVNPITGERTVASDLHNPASGPTGQSPVDVMLVQ